MTDPYIYRCPVSGACLDPLAVRRTLRLSAEDYGAEFNALLDAARADDAKAEAEIVRLARLAFKLPPLHTSGAGFTDASALDALNAFLRWQKGKGPTAQPSRDAVPSTDAPRN